MVITVSRGGYIKRSPLSLYRAQRRGGKGRIGATTKEEDVVEHLFVASTHAYILAFTNRGPDALDQGLRPAAAGPGDARQGDREPAEPRIPASAWSRWPRPRISPRTGSSSSRPRKGLVKKTALSAYSNVRSGGIIAINIEEGDELLSVRVTDGTRQIFIGTRQGQGIRFSEKDVRPMGRDTTGVWGIDAEEGGRLRRRDGRRRRERAAADGDGEGLRQAVRGHRVPLPAARRLGRHQHQGDGEERPGRRDQVRRRRRPAPPDHAERDAHPHQGQGHPRDGPRRPGRAPDQPRRRGPRRGRGQARRARRRRRTSLRRSLPIAPGPSEAPPGGDRRPGTPFLEEAEEE